jgi:hypothetical protein
MFHRCAWPVAHVTERFRNDAISGATRGCSSEVTRTDPIVFQKDSPRLLPVRAQTSKRRLCASGSLCDLDNEDVLATGRIAPV